MFSNHSKSLKASKPSAVIMSVLLAAICSMTVIGCGTSENSGSNNTGTNSDSVSETTVSSSKSSDSSSDSAADTELLSGLHHAEIEVENYGTIYVELDADTAPITVTNFVNLANEGFYDGLTFMRVMEDFMIQGGDPNKDCTGGADTTINGEFSDNGVENNISHVRGTISMARSQDYNSASSQFFICNADATFLDGQYAAFGTVTDGMDVVDAITKDFASYNGVITDVSAQPVITTIKITD